MPTRNRKRSVTLILAIAMVLGFSGAAAGRTYSITLLDAADEGRPSLSATIALP